jgi:hypothetical protein
MLYVLNRYYVSTMLLNFGKLVDHFFMCLLVFRVFLFVFLERNMKHDPFFILNLWLVKLG